MVGTNESDPYGVNEAVNVAAEAEAAARAAFGDKAFEKGNKSTSGEVVSESQRRVNEFIDEEGGLHDASGFSFLISDVAVRGSTITVPFAVGQARNFLEQQSAILQKELLKYTNAKEVGRGWSVTLVCSDGVSLVFHCQPIDPNPDDKSGLKEYLYRITLPQTATSNDARHPPTQTAKVREKLREQLEQ